LDDLRLKLLRRIEELNPEIELEARVAEVTENNASDVMGDADVIVDGMDNWRTRFIVKEYCVTQGTPFIHARVSALHGQVITIMPGRGPCLRCIFPKEPQKLKGFQCWALPQPF